MKYSYMIYIPTLMLGTLMTCTSSSWVMAWVGLEINLMGFLPLIINSLTPNKMETAIKYFLIQTMASMIIILSILMFYAKLNFSNSPIVNSLIPLSLGLKAGVAPLHFWFPQIMASLEWVQLIILTTWQKIAPLILMSFNFSFLMIIFIIASAIIGALNGINQMVFKKLLAFSSIINVSWLITISLISLYSWWVYFLIYSLITLTVVYSALLISLNHLNISNLQKMLIINSMLIFLNIMSLAGLPPLTGFFIKLMVLDLLTNSIFSNILIISLLISSFTSFYFYMRIMYNIFFQVKKKTLILLFDSCYSSYTNVMISISLGLNLFVPLMITLS